MKLRHLLPVFLHSPWFVLTHAHRMLAHTFAGTTWRSLLGLEDARAVFARFRERRAEERRQLLTASADPDMRASHARDTLPFLWRGSSGGPRVAHAVPPAHLNAVRSDAKRLPPEP